MLTGVRIVDAPELHPGCCFLTRTDKGPFVDTMFDVDDLDARGRLYIARSTVADLAGMFGFISPEQAARLRVQVDELETISVEQGKIIDAMHVANEALVKAGYDPLAKRRVADEIGELQAALADVTAERDAALDAVAEAERLAKDPWADIRKEANA